MGGLEALFFLGFDEMEEVGAQVAPPIFIHQTLSSRFHEAVPMAKKRDLPYPSSNFQHQNPQRFQNPRDNWNPKSWDWDSVRFIANPLESELLRLGTATPLQAELKKKQAGTGITTALKKNPLDKDDESLRLKLGGGLSSIEEPVSRPSKRVRSGSPGSSSYPMCQVDNCREDLSNAKDYHRRHKVCEMHSKSTKALVGKQMQRFCQQCSRWPFVFLCLRPCCEEVFSLFEVSKLDLQFDGYSLFPAVLALTLFYGRTFDLKSYLLLLWVFLLLVIFGRSTS